MGRVMERVIKGRRSSTDHKAQQDQSHQQLPRKHDMLLRLGTAGHHHPFLQGGQAGNRYLQGIDGRQGFVVHQLHCVFTPVLANQVCHPGK